MKHELIHNFNTNNKFNTSLMESLRILLKFANVHLEICFIVITYCIKICIQKSNHIMVLLKMKYDDFFINFTKQVKNYDKQFMEYLFN
jgi:hypothetical protein